MAYADIDRFTMGRYSRDYGRGMNHIRAETNRFVGGLEGEFGGGWRWDAYYPAGQTTNRHCGSNARIQANYLSALDPATDPPTADAVCRRLAASAAGCGPINLPGDAEPPPPA